MNIGFDAKRAYQNSTGLGNYSRTLIASLARSFPEHEYFLFTPRVSAMFDPAPFPNVHNVSPASFPAKLLRSAWRSKWVTADLKKNNIDIYHGLSHELPLGMQKTGIASVVTMHDLIFERYPQQFKKADRVIYHEKFSRACKTADRIIAISQQTKRDLVEFYNTAEEKITVCYQSCHPAFAEKIPEGTIETVKKKYGLPGTYFLSVGSIIERKNLLTACRAIKNLERKLDMPLVVIGNGDDYVKLVKKYIAANNLQQQIIFLSEKKEATEQGIKTGSDLPAIFQGATALVYTSIFEGFGIPILEALWSGLPVVSSNASCMPETGGNAVLYADPFDEEQFAAHLLNIANDKALANELKEKGRLHAQNFTQEKCAAAVMNVYNSLKK
ncbi:MAG: glycosyltransferase family 1 protein [Ferruginibacter sp.]